MKVTILGCFGPYPDVDSATSGYFVETKDKRILLDCGSGVLQKLLKHYTYNEIDMIICTHLHSDHISDLGVLKYYFASNKKDIELYIPSSPIEEFDMLNKGIYKINSIHENLELRFGDTLISFKKGIHPYESYLVKIKEANKCLVYSSDTRYFDEIIDFCNNCELLLLNSCYEDIKINNIDENSRFHMSESQCATIAKIANAKMLYLTHFKPGNDIELQYKHAKEIFPNTFISKPHKIIEL